MATLEQALPSSAPAPAVKALSCPNCGGTIEVRAAGYTVVVVCSYCSSAIDVTNPDARLIARFNQATAALDIPLGTRGAIGGVEWEAVGYLMRSEGGSYPWEEYLLFNPYHGYRWLITDGRGWSLGEMLVGTPEPVSGGMKIGGGVYRPFFAQGRARVDYVLGEFYWRVERGEEVETADYVRPGYMLSWERNPSEQSWTLSRLLDPEEVRQAFGTGRPPESWPPMPHQPSPYGPAVRTAGKTAAAALAAMLLMLFLFGGSDTVLRQDMTVAPGAERSATLGPVVLDRAYQAVTVQARAPELENAWIDFDYTLVDRKSGAAFEGFDVAERYSGRDSDGAWSEGSRGATTRFAAVPAGTYDLVVDATANRWTDPRAANGGIFGGQPDGWSGPSEYQVSIHVKRGGAFASNFFLAALLILVPLIWMFIRHVGFEQARQVESDFGPTGAAKMFASGDGEDDE